LFAIIGLILGAITASKGSERGKTAMYVSAAAILFQIVVGVLIRTSR
jgi:hypothetical protein